VALSDAEEEELRAAASSGSNGASKANFSPSSGVAAGSAQARLLTLVFRQEKVRVLDEAIERFARLTGRGAGGNSGGGRDAAAAAS
jgi:hypothetical protein